MARFVGKYCNVKASGTGVVSTGEACTNLDPGTYKVYQVTAAAHQVLDPQAAVTVKKNGVTQAATLYVLDRLFGKVTFTSALLNTDTVTMDVTYLPMTTVAGAHSAEITLNMGVIDATTFASNGDMERASTVRDASGIIDRFTQLDGVFFTAIEAGSVFVVEFWRNATTVDWRSWAILDRQDIKATAKDLVGETVSFDTTRDADGRSVSFG